MSTTTASPPIDEERLNALLGQAVVEFGATVNAALVVIGDRLGLYRELAAGGPLTSAELAARTGTSERYVREWLGAQAASGWVDYDAAGDRYSMSAEQALMFADPAAPPSSAGGFQLALGSADAREHIAESFVTGTGFGWGEHDHDVFAGCQRFFEPGYRANIVQSWIPALDGVHERLAAGGRVADVGCGHGASSIVIAEGYPRGDRPRHRRPRRLDRRGAPPRRGGRGRGPGDVRHRARRRARARRLRPRDHASTACTTWATRSASRARCAPRSRPAARG